MHNVHLGAVSIVRMYIYVVHMEAHEKKAINDM